MKNHFCNEFLNSGSILRVKIEKYRNGNNFPSRFIKNWKMNVISVLGSTSGLFRANFGAKLICKRKYKRGYAEN